jgi:hypothetical protein
MLQMFASRCRASQAFFKASATDFCGTGHDSRAPEQTRRRHSAPPDPEHVRWKEPTIKITMVAALSIATAATALPLAVTARADVTDEFASPSGNIRCDVTTEADDGPLAHCVIGHFTYVAPPGSERDSVSGGPCEPGSDTPNDFLLVQGKSALMTCHYSALNGGFGPWPRLDFGHSRSVGAITCDSEQSGVTCTDSSTGHFFRISRDSYQLG